MHVSTHLAYFAIFCVFLDLFIYYYFFLLLICCYLVKILSLCNCGDIFFFFWLDYNKKVSDQDAHC